MQISAGYRYACAIDDNDVVCWGSNLYGKASKPTILSNAYKLGTSTGQDNVCAIDDTGVVCGGYLGQFTPPLSNPVEVSVGLEDACAIDETGVVCWRDNDSPVFVPVLSNPSQISVGYGHTCALDDTGVICWGSNAGGQTSVPQMANPVLVRAGGTNNVFQGFSCAIDDTSWRKRP